MQCVTLETAKSAKEKGFNLPTIHYYTNRILTLEEKKDGYNFNDNKPPYKLRESSIGCIHTYITVDNLLLHREYDIDAPTQSELQKWLRDGHKIHIVVDFDNSEDKWYYSVSKYLENTVYMDEFVFNSYEEALEQGLRESLKLL